MKKLGKSTDYRESNDKKELVNIGVRNKREKYEGSKIFSSPASSLGINIDGMSANFGTAYIKNVIYSIMHSRFLSICIKFLGYFFKFENTSFYYLQFYLK